MDNLSPGDLAVMMLFKQKENDPRWTPGDKERMKCSENDVDEQK